MSDYQPPRSMLIAFVIFAVVEEILVVTVVHVTTQRWQITAAVAVVWTAGVGYLMVRGLRRNAAPRSSPSQGHAPESASRAPVLHVPASEWLWLPPAGSTVLLRAERVDVTIGGQHILDLDELFVHAGEMVGLAGRNGSGKTTLLRAIGSLIPYRGEITTEASIGFMPDRPALYERLTGTEHIALVMGMWNQPRAKRRAAAQQLLERFGLEEAADRRVRGWSLGMRRKLSLALAVSGRPGLLLLDEPGDGFDDASFDELGTVIAEHLERGGAALVATHDHRILAAAHRVVTIEAGRIEPVSAAS